MPRLKQLVEAINRLAPFELAESWDRVGLQIGRSVATVQRILVAVDLNHPVLQEGQNHQVDGFIVHHPFLFKPLTGVNPSELQGQLLSSLIKHDQFVLVAHTNMDKAEHGINQYLAESLGLTRIQPLEPALVPTYKVVVFTPPTHAEQLREAMAMAGAGEIGEYRECSFSCNGTGTFKPGSRARPYLGQPGRLEAVPEMRLELNVIQSGLNKVLQAVYRYHPYEEPVVDVYPLSNPSRHGMGRIGHLAEPLPLAEFQQRIKVKLGLEAVKVSGEPAKPIAVVAVCSGSGGSLIRQAAQQNADLYLTGELNYHDHWEARERGLAVIEAGHAATENCFITLVSRYLEEIFADDSFQIIRSGFTGEPYRIA